MANLRSSTLSRAPRTLVVAGLWFGLLCAAAAPAWAKPTPPKQLETRLDKPVVLRYKHTPKQTLRYTTRMRQALDMKPLGETAKTAPKLSTSSNITAQMVMKTVRVTPDGNADVETSYANFALKLSQGGVDVPDKQLAPLTDMIRKVRTVSTITTRGEPLKTDISGVNPAMKPMIESMKTALVGLTPVFPKGELKVGQSWLQRVPMVVAQGPVRIKLSFAVTYTFLGFTNLKGARVAVLRSDIKTNINDVPSPKTAKPQQGSIKVKGAGTGIGFLYFDNAAGRLVKSELEMDQTTRLKADPGGDKPVQRVEMSQTTTTTVDLAGTKASKRGKGKR